MSPRPALAQFEGVEAVKHFWPMVRSEGHLDRVLMEIAPKPGLVIYTLVNSTVRERSESRCHAMGLPRGVGARSGDRRAVASARPGDDQPARAASTRSTRPISLGSRRSSITIAHDDGIASDDWEEADIVLAGVSRSSKTPTSIYLANRGYQRRQHSAGDRKPAAADPVPASASAGRRSHHQPGSADPDPPQPTALAQPDRRDRLCRPGAVARELAYARRMFADNGWPVIDVTRRSIEETAAAIINLVSERREKQELAAATGKAGA